MTNTPSRLRCALALALIASPASAGAPSILDGTVTHVRDADTLEVNGIAVRLAGVTADELHTPLGNLAAAIVRSAVLDEYAVYQ